MTKNEILEDLRLQRDSGRLSAVRSRLEEMHAADIAQLLEDRPVEEVTLFFRLLSKTLAANVFSYLSLSRQLELVSLFSTEEAAGLIDRLYVDDAVDLLEEMPANAVRTILKNTPAPKREQLNRFLKYADNSAGSVMTAEFIQIFPFMSVGQAIQSIRSEKNLLDSFSEVFVTSRDLKLLGVLSLRELLRADDETNIIDVMHENVVSVTTDTDQEDALQIISKYDFSALPVTDSENRLVGIITADDALDISTQESNEDFHIMAAMQPTDESYLDTSVITMAKNRLPWLLFLMLSGMINGLILGGFENSFLAVPILVTFIPVLTDTGGNTGSQSSTLIIRGLATGEIKWSDTGRVLWKEFRVALFVGGALGILSFLRVFLFAPHNLSVGIVVGVSIFLIILLSKLLGGILPLIAEHFGADPALMAAPLITTIIDACGLIIFFLLAKLILHL